MDGWRQRDDVQRTNYNNNYYYCYYLVNNAINNCRSHRSYSLASCPDPLIYFESISYLVTVTVTVTDTVHSSIEISNIQIVP